MSGLANAVAITAGGNHSCALLANGTAKCWGYNFSGQLGNGNTTSASTPVVVSGLSSGSKAVAVSVGSNHSCALLANGFAKCWGDNAFGQLGNGNTTNSSTPVVVSGLTNTGRDLGDGQSFVCIVGERGRQMLGFQRLRAIGQRQHDRLVDTRHRERPHQRDHH